MSPFGPEVVTASGGKNFPKADVRPPSLARVFARRVDRLVGRKVFTPRIWLGFDDEIQHWRSPTFCIARI
jgi:hypothetical protein